ncbi:hypothetical protein N7474_003702 [Penicillium riverlandense]|uniref:uncharacterized protein n=1 Tax=Penicillium riverlandense TaxID=1903569 RepID=UPI0025473813|nr:uncharacterized protein N7474_003702 [Penicillium riverlandense]KAJ5818111.1 hypothetical protein N7474_003702 [Penicillium riverlandense]
MDSAEAETPTRQQGSNKRYGEKKDTKSEARAFAAWATVPFTNTFAIMNMVNSKRNTHDCKARSAAQSRAQHPAAGRRSPGSGVKNV